MKAILTKVLLVVGLVACLAIEAKAVEVIPLSVEEQSATGATHLVKVKHPDLTQTSNNTTQTIALLTVSAGDIVTLAGTKLKTPFSDASDAAFNSTAVTIGDGDSAARYLASTELNVNGSEIDFAPGTGTRYAYNAADTVDIVFSSMANKALVDIDGGELHVYLRVWQLNKIKPPID